MIISAENTKRHENIFDAHLQRAFVFYFITQGFAVAPPWADMKSRLWRFISRENKQKTQFISRQGAKSAKY